MHLWQATKPRRAGAAKGKEKLCSAERGREEEERRQKRGEERKKSNGERREERGEANVR